MFSLLGLLTTIVSVGKRFATLTASFSASLSARTAAFPTFLFKKYLDVFVIPTGIIPPTRPPIHVARANLL